METEEIQKNTPVANSESETGVPNAPVAVPTVTSNIKKDPNVIAAENTELTRKKLEAEEQITFFLPPVEGEPKGTKEVCGINGVQYEVEKGIPTKIPRSIAEILANKFKIQMSAGSQARVDRDPEVERALN